MVGFAGSNLLSKLLLFGAKCLQVMAGFYRQEQKLEKVGSRPLTITRGPPLLQLVALLTKEQY
jgi:hypothetical protein